MNGKALTESKDTTASERAQALTRHGYTLVRGHKIGSDGGCTCSQGKACPTPGKHPIGGNWADHATNDPAKIAKWFEYDPEPTFGNATGAVSGIISWDVDKRHGGLTTLAELEAEYGPLPPTPTVVTGGGGRQYHFRHPGGSVRNLINRLPGIDFRGDGGYAILPESRHKSGNLYGWLDGHSPDNVPIADMPEWLLALVSRRDADDGAGGGDPVTVDLITDLLYKHNLYTTTKVESYGTVLPLAYCPTAPGYASGQPAHDDGAWIQVSAGASVTFRCHHNGCQGKDFDDFLKALGDPALPQPQPVESDDDETDNDDPEPATEETAPRIPMDDNDLPAMTAAAWAALQRRNDPVRLVMFGGNPGRIESVEGKPLIRGLKDNHLRYEVARAATFTQWRRQQGRAVLTTQMPPKDVIADMLATERPPLPILSRIVEAPVFGPNGELQTEPGYHPAGKTYYAPAPGFVVPAVPAIPSAADIEEALRLIGDELYGDFPFLSASDKAAAIGLFLLPYVRDLIDGPTPIHLIEAPSPGTGKDLLADAATRPALGRQADILTEAGTEDEWRKRLTSALRNAPTVLQISNVNKPLDSGSLAQAVLTAEWTDRVLGYSETITAPVRCAWIVTGNNPVLSGEIVRRTVRIRLDAKTDMPYLREGFRHNDLRGWADENRGRLVWAGLTLTRHWLATGAKPGKKTLGSLEAWSRVIGGILDSAGVPGFLDNLVEFYESADVEGQAWRSLIGLWWETFGGDDVKAGQLYSLIEGSGIDGFDFGKGSLQAQKTSFGMQLGKQRDRVYGRYRVSTGTERRGQAAWKLIRDVPETQAEREEREVRNQQPASYQPAANLTDPSRFERAQRPAA